MLVHTHFFSGRGGLLLIEHLRLVDQDPDLGNNENDDNNNNNNSHDGNNDDSKLISNYETNFKPNVYYILFQPMPQRQSSMTNRA